MGNYIERQAAPAPPTTEATGAQQAVTTLGASVVATSESVAVGAERRYYAAAGALIVVGLLVGWCLLTWRHGPNAPLPQLSPGVGAFAVLYIFAQSIERLIEPVSPFLGSILGVGNKSGESEDKKKKYKKELITDRNKYLVEAKTGGDKAVAKQCADAQYLLNQFRRNSATLAFGTATLLAMLGAGVSGFLLLHIVGLTDAPTMLDLFITGLAVGGGTKPLHDLITNITESTNSKQDPAELQT